MCKELLCDLSIYFTALDAIGWSIINERLHDMTPNRMLLDVSVSQKKKRYIKNLILFRLFCVVHILNVCSNMAYLIQCAISATTNSNVVSLNPIHGKVYLIQHVIKLISDMRQVSGIL